MGFYGRCGGRGKGAVIDQEGLGGEGGVGNVAEGGDLVSGYAKGG